MECLRVLRLSPLYSEESCPGRGDSRVRAADRLGVERDADARALR